MSLTKHGKRVSAHLGVSEVLLLLEDSQLRCNIMGNNTLVGLGVLREAFKELPNIL